MAVDNETVEYDIRLEAQHALIHLSNLSHAVVDFDKKMKMAQATVASFAARTKTSMQEAANIFKRIDEVASSFGGEKGGSIIFGPGGAKNWDAVGKSAQQAEQKVGQASKGIIGHFSAMRIAWGIFISSLIHGVANVIVGVFTTASNNARQLEDSLYRIANAERILSEEGKDISLKGLEEGIQRIKNLLPIFSREDVSGLVGQVAISTKELQLTEDQIINLAEAIAVLNVRSAENETLQQTAQKVISSLLTSNAKGVSALGLSFSKTRMEAKGMELGIIDANKKLSDLNDQEKGQIKLAIVLENTGKEIGSIGEYLDSNTAKIQSNKAAWMDLLTTLGQFVNNLIPNITPVVEATQKTVEVNSIQELFKQGLKEKGSRFLSKEDADVMFKLATGIKLTSDEYEHLKSVLASLPEDVLLKIFPDPSSIKDRFVRELVQGLVTVEDTATNTTAAIDDLGDAIDEIDTEKMLDEVQDILDKSREAQEDLDIEMGRKTLDLDVEYDRKGADAYLDYQRKVEDINRDTEDKITEIKQKRREEDVKREAEYQNKLWELQQKYLMDLEDALHNRDARQIIRLQRQYELEKQTLERKNELDAKQSRLDEKSDIKKVKDDQKDKLEDAAVDYQRKLQDLNIAKAREQEDLQKWYDREQQDIQLDQERKLQALAEGWVEAGILTEENAARIYGILAGYFGPGGLTDQIYAYMRASLAQAMSMAGGISLPMGQPAPYSQLAAQSAYTPTSTPVQQLTSGGYKESYTPTFIPRPGGYAEGGAFLATTRDSITVGERGPELVQTTPIGRIGNDTNKLFMGAGGDSGGEAGVLEIGVSLSPDLEARVIRKTMDSAANVILKVNRTKV